MKFLVIGVGEAGFGEAFDGFVGVVNALDDAWTFEVLNCSAQSSLPAMFVNVNSAFPASGTLILAVLVNVTVGVSSDVDWFLP